MSTIGAATREDERMELAERTETQACAASYGRLLAALADLYEGRTCKAVEGSARIVVANALGLSPVVSIREHDLVWEKLPSGEWAWLTA